MKLGFFPISVHLSKSAANVPASVLLCALCGKGPYCRSFGSALLIASRTARTNSSREANCFGSIGG